MSIPSTTDILGAVTRGWTHEKNRHKVMDPDLAIAISAEVYALLDPGECPQGVDHEIVSARNEIVTSGLICAKCKAIFSESILDEAQLKAVNAGHVLKDAPTGVKVLPGLDDRASEWDAWHEEFKRSHGYGPGIGDAWDAAYRVAWKRATSGVDLPAEPNSKGGA